MKMTAFEKINVKGMSCLLKDDWETPVSGANFAAN